MRNIAIAIDGPAGAGKSSVAKIVARRLGYAYLDTGAMYRAVTYEVMKQNITETQNIINLAENLHMTVNPSEEGIQIIINGEDVTAFIREPEVSAKVSAVAAIGKVREAMVVIQRKQASLGGIVLDGRDIGTTVLPDADVKIFLTASVHIRALRRYKELKEVHPEITLMEIKKDIEKRDRQDRSREVSPLRCAKDAVLLDNSEMTLEETAETIIRICHKKMNINGK